MSNLPQKYNETIFQKINNFIMKAFLKNKNEMSNVKSNFNEKVDYEQKKDFNEALKTELNKEVMIDFEKNKLINKIEEHPELLKQLSLERLLQLDEYYDSIIEEYKEKIKVLKQNA